MEATLFHNKSDRLIANKDITPLEVSEGVTTFNVEILTPSSVTRPKLRLSSGLEAIKANYLFLTDLNRYYYITDYTLENGYITIECEVDVLMSSITELVNSPVVLDRQSLDGIYNLYLPDDQYPIEQPNNVRTIAFPNSFNEEISYILAIAGDNQ